MMLEHHRSAWRFARRRFTGVRVRSAPVRCDLPGFSGCLWRWPRTPGARAARWGAEGSLHPMGKASRSKRKRAAVRSAKRSRNNNWWYAPHRARRDRRHLAHRVRPGDRPDPGRPLRRRPGQPERTRTTRTRTGTPRSASTTATTGSATAPARACGTGPTRRRRVARRAPATRTSTPGCTATPTASSTWSRDERGRGPPRDRREVLRVRRLEAVVDRLRLPRHQGEERRQVRERRAGHACSGPSAKWDGSRPPEAAEVHGPARATRRLQARPRRRRDHRVPARRARRSRASATRRRSRTCRARENRETAPNAMPSVPTVPAAPSDDRLPTAERRRPHRPASP